MNDNTFKHGTRSSYSHHKCRCEPCVSAQQNYNRRYHEANRERILARMQKRHAEHKDLDAAYYLKNRERYQVIRESRLKERAAWAARHHEKNRDEIRAQKREYYQSEGPQIRARVRAYNSRGSESATRQREPWSVHEDEIVMRLDLSSTEKAYMLGRTVGAVNARKRIVRKSA